MNRILETVGIITQVLFFVSALYLVGDVIINIKAYLYGDFTTNCYQDIGLGYCFGYGLCHLGVEINKRLFK